MCHSADSTTSVRETEHRLHKWEELRFDLIILDSGQFMKQLLTCLVQLLEDALQMHRLQYVIDGREGDTRDEHVQGMLGECCHLNTK